MNQTTLTIMGFFGLTSENFLNNDVTIDFGNSKIIVGNFIREFEIGVKNNDFYFFFSNSNGIIFRLHVYIGGLFITGDIRKRIGYQDYELISFLKNTNNNGVQLFQNLTTNVVYFKKYFQELIDSE
jgi:hypothetical protein